MRVSCACPASLASEHLAEELRSLGIQPIITSQVIRAVYDGPDKAVGTAIVNIYLNETDHEINVQYGKDEQRKLERKLERKYHSAVQNARLHGHDL